MLPETGGYIFVSRNQNGEVELDDILYIEGLKNYVSFMLKHNVSSLCR
jgi:hypothetical protein